MSELEITKRKLEAALGFIDNMGCDLLHRRVADWYQEGAHNAAEQMSEDMRLFGNACMEYEALSDELPNSTIY